MTEIAEIMAEMNYSTVHDSLDEGRAWIESRAIARHFINGRPCEGGDLRPVLNPATGTQLARVPLAREAELSAALASARQAQSGWAALGGEGRARHLFALAHALQKQERLFAETEALNLGGSLRALRERDLPLAIQSLRHHAGSALQRDEASSAASPHGICAGLCTRQAPLLTAVTLLAPALAAGNVVVLKPSHLTPLSADLLAGLAQDSGLPPGVLTLLQGDEETGALLSGHPEVDMVAFCGSAASAVKLREALAGRGKALALSITGSATFILLEDADPDAAAEALAESLRLRPGDSGPRLLVQEGIAADFTARLKARLARRPDEALLCTPATPVTFRTAEEALQLAAHARFPQSASIWSETITVASDLALRVKAAEVWINCIGERHPGTASFGIGFDPQGDSRGVEVFLRAPAAGGIQRPDPAAPWSEDQVTGRPGATEEAPLKHWIGGKFTAGDAGLSLAGPGGPPVASGNRKDIRNAVEAAVKATAWPALSSDQRAQALWSVAEHLRQRQAEFAALTSDQEVEEAIRSLFATAALAGHIQGRVQETKPGYLTLERFDPLGVIAILCPPEAPLARLIALTAPALAMGNRVVCVPSEAAPHVGAKLAQVFALSDLPAGALNIVTGPQLPLAEVLALHEEVSAIWSFGTAQSSARAEALSAATLNPCFTEGGNSLWQRGTTEMLKRAARSRTIWLPYGA
ncbi:aldehyde dehydrogenase family protein [Falsigemmobacter intermedius]|uniref:aldehyde dehydrogenase family protein n=1 Tax=Falsigemmobacter intermedius TaxID=1553448 RepID=UPI003EFBB7BA